MLMIRSSLALFLFTAFVQADVMVDTGAFGKSLGGWEKGCVYYEFSGADYRSHKPETTPSPDGGIFVSLRIDHRRGWLASDDHAVLEVSFAQDGTVTSAKSTVAVQGKTIASDLIRSSANAGAKLTGVQEAVQVGGNLVTDLTSKLLREKIVEPGRVSFPAVVRHNYNLLFQAIRQLPDESDDSGKSEETEVAPEPQKEKASSTKLEILPYNKK